MKNLNDKINIVLNEEKIAYSFNGRRGGGLGSFNIKIGGDWIKEGEVPKFIVDKPGLEFIVSPNAIVLVKLYSSLNDLEKDDFVKILLSYLSKNSPYSDVAYLILFVLYRVGKTIEAITQARKNLKDDIHYGYSDVLGMLSKIIKYEHSFISAEILEQIKEALTGDAEPNFELFRRINSALLSKLSLELEGNNIEINADKETLRKIFKKYGFPLDLLETLDKIDEKFNTANDNFDYKGCMDLIRSFTERFYKTIAILIDKDLGSKLDEKDSEEIAKYLQGKGVISDDQGKILMSLRHFLSNFGSHRLKSRPEDARLSRNMAIEFTLYITRRYEEVTGQSY